MLEDFLIKRWDEEIYHPSYDFENLVLNKCHTGRAFYAVCEILTDRVLHSIESALTRA